MPPLPTAPEGVSESDWAALLAEGIRSEFADGELICMVGDACKGWPFVLRGAIRLYAMSEEGREITLYKLGPGKSCILTATCILGEHPFPAYAAAIGDTEVLLLPPQVFYRWFNESAPWRRHVCGLLTDRLIGVITALEEVAFHGVDRRLASYLLANLDEEATVHATHAAAAAEVGTSREVVSRILKDFERQELVQIGRGRVRVPDPERLRTIAEPAW